MAERLLLFFRSFDAAVVYVLFSIRFGFALRAEAFCDTLSAVARLFLKGVSGVLRWCFYNNVIGSNYFLNILFIVMEKSCTISAGAQVLFNLGDASRNILCLVLWNFLNKFRASRFK